ncbi:MAG: hypothetical protein OQK12_06965, partial [Motiliproteus sp.]|nr:hypothetical protein [Motiliproteus sp.]
GAAVAIGIVILTHRLSDQSSKNELKLKKLEEIYRASITYRKQANQLLNLASVVAGRPTVGKNNLDLWHQYQQAKDDLEILVTLHGSFVSPYLEAMQLILCRSTTKEKPGNPPPNVEDNYHGYLSHYQENLSNFDARLLKEIKKYTS